MATSVYYICNVGFFDIPLAQDDIFVFLAFDSDTYVFSAWETLPALKLWNFETLRAWETLRALSGFPCSLSLPTGLTDHCSLPEKLCVPWKGLCHSVKCFVTNAAGDKDESFFCQC